MIAAGPEPTGNHVETPRKSAPEFLVGIAGFPGFREEYGQLPLRATFAHPEALWPGPTTLFPHPGALNFSGPSRMR